jgi:hypothetical protein
MKTDPLGHRVGDDGDNTTDRQNKTNHTTHDTTQDTDKMNPIVTKYEIDENPNGTHFECPDCEKEYPVEQMDEETSMCLRCSTIDELYLQCKQDDETRVEDNDDDDDVDYETIDDLMVAIYEIDKGVTRSKLLSLFEEEADDPEFNNHHYIKAAILYELPNWRDEFNRFSSEKVSEWVIGYINQEEDE